MPLDALQFVQNIKKYCALKGVKPTAACKESGVGTSFINNVERGQTPSVAKVQMLADYLGVTVSDLLGERTPTRGDVLRIPVLGTIPAGVPLEAIEDILDWEELPVAWGDGGREYFALRVQGDSMYPSYLEGDTVILRKQDSCDSGDDCAVLVNGQDATLKEVRLRENGGLELRPRNPAYPPKLYDPADVQNLPVTILGVVVELRRKVK